MSKSKIKFEDAIEKLDEIAKELESGKLDLEETMVKFEEGMKLSKECNDMLENAEKKITILLQGDNTEEIIEKDFLTEE